MRTRIINERRRDSAAKKIVQVSRPLLKTLTLNNCSDASLRSQIMNKLLACCHGQPANLGLDDHNKVEAAAVEATCAKESVQQS